jgi:two-component system response regulator HydG
VLLTGETGTGKDLAAKAIHYNSDRAAKLFVNITASALPEQLLESELFGHERGAFTDARQQKRGLIETADGGTLFLDEIGEMTPALQSKLLRVLEEKAFKRVGGLTDIRVDARVIAATNRNLEEEVKASKFREDLFYRLQVMPIALPPLRERPGDVAALARHFLARRAPARRGPRDFTPAALARLERHPWPGNVRELENVVQHALVFAEGELVGEGDLPSLGGGPALPVPTGDRPLPDILEELERRLVVAAYERARGVKAEAARLLGITPGALYYKLEKYGVGREGEP